MEVIKSKVNLDTLLSELNDYSVLESSDKALFEELSAELEAEYGDLGCKSNAIQADFQKVYEQIPSDSSLKRPFSGPEPSMLHTDDYYQARNIDYLEELLHDDSHTLEIWSKWFYRVVLPGLFRDIPGEIRDGGLKTVESVQERIAARLSTSMPQPLNFIRDIIRGRFIGHTLRDVERAFQILRETTIGDIVTVINRYHTLVVGVRGNFKVKPFIAANVVFRIDKNLTYELQLMTKRAALIEKLDHPVIKNQVILSAELKDYLAALSWGSHLKDFREYFDEQ